MGHSFVTYRGQRFRVNDGILEIWLYFIVKAMEAEPNPSEWLLEIKDYWKILYSYPIPGVVSPELDQYADTDSHRREILRFCKQAYQELIEADVLTKEWLNESGIGGEGVTYYEDLDTELFAQAARQFMELLQQSA